MPPRPIRSPSRRPAGRPAHHRPTHHRRRVAQLLSAVVGVLLLAGCGTDAGGRPGADVPTDPPTPRATPGATVPSGAASSSPAGPTPGRSPSAATGNRCLERTGDERGRTLPRRRFVPEGEHAVGRVDRTFVDRSRDTAAHGEVPTRPRRVLGVRLFYPVPGPAGEPVADGAAPARGSFPLVVFSHGLGADAASYGELGGAIAAAGYVVAMPTFPLSSRPVGSYLDVVNQPDDVSFVLDCLASRPGRPGGAIDHRRVGVAGHSLGAVTSLGVAFHDQLRDDRVDAVAAVSGAEFDLGAGGYRNRPPVPVLLAHGTADTVLPVRGSRQVFRAATGPAYLLRYPGTGHNDLFLNERGALLLQVLVGFLDTHLRGEDDALRRVAATVRESGLATWAQRNTG